MQDNHSRLCGVTHDIRNVLARAMLAAEQLQHHEDRHVSTQAVRIGAAIDQVTRICREESARAFPARGVQDLTSEGMTDLLQHVINLAKIESMSGEKQIDFSLSVAEDTRLQADASSVFRIVFNLVHNAVKAVTNQGGSQIDILVARFGSIVQIGVIDDGPGLPDHVVTRLFPHLSDKRPAGQIGAGLVTAASLAENLEGHLDLVDSSTSGTHFVVTLPTFAAAATADKSHGAPCFVGRDLIEAFR